MPPGSECSWHITAPTYSDVVKIDFSFFKMAKNCEFHYVALFDAEDCTKESLTEENQVNIQINAENQLN